MHFHWPPRYLFSHDNILAYFCAIVTVKLTQLGFPLFRHPSHFGEQCRRLNHFITFNKALWVSFTFICKNFWSKWKYSQFHLWLLTIFCTVKCISTGELVTFLWNYLESLVYRMQNPFFPHTKPELFGVFGITNAITFTPIHQTISLKWMEPNIWKIDTVSSCVRFTFVKATTIFNCSMLFDEYWINDGRLKCRKLQDMLRIL